MKSLINRKVFAIFLLLFVVVQARSQQDAKLLARLDTVLRFTQEGNYGKVLDYTYPKLFTLVGRDLLEQTMQSSLDNEEFKSTLDSLKLIKVHPVFSINNAQYALIKHSMIMRMRFADTIDDEEAAAMIKEMSPAYGAGNIRFDKPNNTVVIKMMPVMLAIKDEYSPEWTFINYEEEGEMAAQLFSKELMEKLRQYN